jgi:hypothetical protein
MARSVTLAEFDRLTMNKQLQRYIALLDGRIEVYEVPNCPHGEVIGYITLSICNQLGIGSPGAIMASEIDNGVIFLKCADKCRYDFEQLIEKTTGLILLLDQQTYLQPLLRRSGSSRTANPIRILSSKLRYAMNIRGRSFISWKDTSQRQHRFRSGLE